MLQTAVILLFLFQSCYSSEAADKVTVERGSKKENIQEQTHQISETVKQFEMLSSNSVKDSMKLFSFSEPVIDNRYINTPKINEVQVAAILKSDDKFEARMQSCPTWMYRINSTSDCQCGSDISGTVNCNKKMSTVSVVSCHCITYDEERETLVAATCFYGCRVESLYEQLPPNVSEVNRITCGKLNREGRLCAKCIKGFYPLLYSFDFHCVNCSHSNYNWVKFAAVATIPSTFCFFSIIICKINALSPQLHGFVQITQAFGAAINLRTILFVGQGNSLEIFFTKLIALPYGVINLDFFRTYINDICVDLTTLQVLSLDYITATYPLLLIILSYILIELHARNCWLIVRIWKPFRVIFKSGNWDIHYSLINAFATFLLLSYGKLLSVTFDLLIPTKVYNVTGDFLGFYLYYDASYKYFSQEHLPYASLAIVISTIFLLPPPLLLLFYPMSWFQKCLNFRNPRIHTFVECYHGYYKDGTDPGTRDCRWIAAMYFIWKIIFVFIFYALTRNVLCYTFTVISLTVVGIIIMTIKPYKAPYSIYNNVDSGMIFLMAMWCASITCVNEAKLRAKNLVVLFLSYPWLTLLL